MGTFVFISLLVTAIALFLAKNWISNDTLQRLANATAVVSLIAAAIIFIVPSATPSTESTDASPNSSSNYFSTPSTAMPSVTSVPETPHSSQFINPEPSTSPSITEPTPTVSPLSSNNTPNFLKVETRLRVGEELRSTNGQFSLRLQDDGNLVLYNEDNTPLWSSNTRGKNTKDLVMQMDGNLVLYEGDGDVVWASDTASDKFEENYVFQLENVTANALWRSQAF